MYHMVSNHRSKARFNKLRVPASEFERQVAWLSRNGFEFIFASQLDAGATTSKKTVCLTFDDGYADNLTNADPILKKHNAVATLYLVEDRLGGWSSKKKQHHGDEELAAEPKLSDQQVAQMVTSGRWELGGHTVTHANLPTLSEAEAKYEIQHSKDEFPRRFSVTPQTFAYPFGIYGQRESRLALEGGFSASVTTEPGIFDGSRDDRMQIPRIKVSGKEGMMAFIIRIKTGRRGVLK